MKLKDIGEFGIIEILKRKERKGRGTVVGIGDDAAVLEIRNPNIEIRNKFKKSKSSNSQKYLLATTDTMVEDVHFKVKKGIFFDLGQKAMISNISDISAMGGVPRHALITVGLRKDLDMKDIEALYDGIDSLAKKCNIDIVGGDTVSSPKALFITITLLGEVEKENLLLRSGAKVGDLICVTGKFGRPAANRYAPRHASRITRHEEARILAKTHALTSMIDSSDGLARSIIEICKASKTGAVIHSHKVPKAKGATLDQALYGGEEYELVFTIPASRMSKIPKSIRMLITIVGEIQEKSKGICLVDYNGKRSKLKGGYEHFI